ncbi:MAG TPA: GAF domain-containing protein, partial [Kofleriaceae bacterium]|nr:GAF domain-containing protein [Kofleriaceae bacterium]
MRALPCASALDRPTLLDHIPELLDRIAQLAVDPSRVASEREACAHHALARLHEGFDLSEVISEFRVLRQAILQALSDPSVGFLQASELRLVDDAIDEAIAESVKQYTATRDRTLLGLDRVATAALQSESLDELLGRLLEVLRETTPAIDTAAIYLRDGDVLHLRAGVGVERDVEVGVVIQIGDGFAGQVAARNEPLTLQNPRPEDIRSPALARASLRVLYGVPIVDGGVVIGVAKIGSINAPEFSEADQRVFSAMVARATAAIIQHVLRDQARAAAIKLAQRDEQFRALADNMAQLAWMADPTGSIHWYNRRWYDYTGTTFEEMQGWGWEKVHHPDHLQRVVTRWKRAIDRGEPWEDTFPLRGHDGFYRWFLSRAMPIRDEAGAILHWFGTNTDVTLRRFLDQTTKLLARSLDYRELLRDLAASVIPDFADCCVIDVLEGDKVRHVAYAHVDPTKQELLAKFVAGHEPQTTDANGSWQVLRANEPILIPDVPDTMLSSPDFTALGFKSWIGAPLLARGRAVGVIHLMTSDSGRRYTERDLEVAVELGHRAGGAVDNTRLYAQAQAALGVRDDILAIVSHDLRTPLSSLD